MSEGWFAEDGRPPEPFRTVAHHVFWRDRRWFAAHPGVYECEREYVEGEFWLHGEDYRPAQAIERVRVSLVDLFDGDLPDRGFIRLRDSIPAEPPFLGLSDPEDAANWMVQDGPPG